MSKKKGAQEISLKAQVLGRVGTNLEIGIVGLPNVGKSSFFNVLTNSQVLAENYPFATIDPNTARVAVPDERFDWLVDYWKPASVVPAVLNVTDIAGLVKGANEGEGLGNAFLSHIKAVDAIFHMVRAFDDTEITHVEGSIDPIRDIKIINRELRLKDISFLEKHREVTAKLAKQKKEKAEEVAVCDKALKMLREDELEVRFGDWKAKEIEILNTLQLLTAKTVVYLINMSPNDYAKKKNKYLPELEKYIVEERGEQMVPFSVAFEEKFQKLDEEKKKIMRTERKLDSMLPTIIKIGYKALGLIYFFTAGKDEVRAWTIKQGMKAPQAGGKIHSDFEKLFICCEVMAFNDFKELGSEAACRSAGKYLQQGKSYVVNDGDIIYFKSGAK
jgi:obg-like ATPase 1